MRREGQGERSWGGGKQPPNRFYNTDNPVHAPPVKIGRYYHAKNIAHMKPS